MTLKGRQKEPGISLSVYSGTPASSPGLKKKMFVIWFQALARLISPPPRFCFGLNDSWILDIISVIILVNYLFNKYQLGVVGAHL